METFDRILREPELRRILVRLGFIEVTPGWFLRADAPQGIAWRPGDVRYTIGVRLESLVGNARALLRLLARYPDPGRGPVR